MWDIWVIISNLMNWIFVVNVFFLKKSGGKFFIKSVKFVKEGKKRKINCLKEGWSGLC